jgi:hypothetical protein
MSIQALKILVAAMGVLIVVGVTVFAVTVANRLQAARYARTAPPARVELALPEGARVVETVPDGDRLLLRLDTPRGTEVLIVDLASGTLVTTVVLTTER